MASLEAKLAESLNETRNLRGALEKEVEERRRDHDEIVGFREKIKTAYKRIEDLEGEKKAERTEGSSRNWQLWVLILTPLISGIVTGVVMWMMRAR